jgi:hypothetical protein
MHSAVYRELNNQRGPAYLFYSLNIPTRGNVVFTNFLYALSALSPFEISMFTRTIRSVW